MAKLLLVVGIVSFDADYYHFQHTEATNVMLIAEQYGGEENDYFHVQLPTDFLFYERSWLHTLCSDYDSGRPPDTSGLYLNDAELSYLSYNDTACHTVLELLSVAQLPTGVSHEIRVTLDDEWGSPMAFCGLSLVYREAP